MHASPMKSLLPAMRLPVRAGVKFSSRGNRRVRLPVLEGGSIPGKRYNPPVPLRPEPLRDPSTAAEGVSARAVCCRALAERTGSADGDPNLRPALPRRAQPAALICNPARKLQPA